MELKMLMISGDIEEEANEKEGILQQKSDADADALLFCSTISGLIVRTSRTCCQGRTDSDRIDPLIAHYRDLLNSGNILAQV